MPKCYGGLGFRDLKIFNDALLAKQAWRLMHDSNTMVSRVFKARYYKNSDFLDSFRGLIQDLRGEASRDQKLF